MSCARKTEAVVTNSAVPSMFTVAPIGRTNCEKHHVYVDITFHAIKRYLKDTFATLVSTLQLRVMHCSVTGRAAAVEAVAKAVTQDCRRPSQNRNGFRLTVPLTRII